MYFHRTLYCIVLIDCIKCAVRYPSVADNVVDLLMDFLNGQGALDVVLFVREMVETYPDLRQSVLTKLIDCFSEIKDPSVYRVALWILGMSYCITVFG